MARARRKTPKKIKNKNIFWLVKRDKTRGMVCLLGEKIVHLSVEAAAIATI